MLPVVFVAGFLGAGKTTLLKHLLVDARNCGLRVAVIINEFGAVDIDGAVLRAAKVDEIASIAGGCACCSGQDEFIETLVDIATRVDLPDVILVEASGLVDPVTILEMLAGPELLSLAQVSTLICVADASNWNATAGEMGLLLRRQIALADWVVLNKIDEAKPDALDALEARLRELNPRAHIARTVQGFVDAAPIWNFHFAARDTSTLPLAPHAQSHTLWFPIPHPVERARLEMALGNVDERVWRAKGFVRLRSESGLYLVQFTGGEGRARAQIGPFHPPFGADEPPLGLVFIGAHLQPSALESAFGSSALGAMF
jgi:G3E family GTPase